MADTNRVLRYERRGSCGRCGTCCLTEDCEHLQFNEVGLATCLTFDSPDRPLKCSRHPQAPPILIQRCGYYFVDTYENNRVVGHMEV